MIKPMLAHDLSDKSSRKKVNSYTENNQHEMFVQPKLDGVRVVGNLKNGKMFKRSGKEVTSCPHLHQELIKIGKLSTFRSLEWLDGELFNDSLTFSEINSIVSRTKNLHDNHKEIQFHVFDVVMDSSFSNRKREISRLAYTHPVSISPYIKTVETISLGHISYKGLQMFDKYCQDFIECGYEGLMVRIDNLPYENKRSNQLFKYKYFKDSEYTILDAVEQNNHPNVLGSFLVTDGKVSFRVRPSVTKEELKEYWKNKDDHIGKLATVKYQEITDDGYPRFPVMVGIREDL